MYAKLRKNFDIPGLPFVCFDVVWVRGLHIRVYWAFAYYGEPERGVERYHVFVSTVNTSI